MRTRGLVPAALVAALCGCSDEPRLAPASKAAAAVVTKAAPDVTGRCPVSRPGAELPLPERGFNYGDERLAVALWPNGRLLAGELPDGGAWAVIHPDGSIEAKLGWWRGLDGVLRIEGERLDGAAPPLVAHVAGGYGFAGFQPSSLVFPATGCWRVAARLGDERLEFVVRVRKLRGGR